ncbi:ribonuclease H family protein [Erythrobacter aureus]|uniref:Ribonuclease HI n=1 Tax=Erythrobacter aureus TaxID=2182384 RepID=A0A345YIY7_9SPHN|nr:ribonuclease H [Erythrobacter aureus]AXK43889.1 ribonuclease HI [Erythrobacter aureus]
MITIATDGSCIGNPGPGAYAFVVEIDGGISTESYFVEDTTVGEMEVRGLLEALLYVSECIDGQDRAADVLIQCDAQYVVKGFNEWMANWKAKGWRKKGGLAHAQLWEQIDAAKSRISCPLRVEWVRAHQNKGTLNDKVDAAANNTARTGVPTSPLTRPRQATLTAVSEDGFAPATVQPVAPAPAALRISRDLTNLSYDEAAQKLARSLWIRSGNRADLWDQVATSQWDAHMKDEKAKHLQIAYLMLEDLGITADEQRAAA